MEDLLDYVKKFVGTEPVPLESYSGWQWEDLDLESYSGWQWGDLDLNFRLCLDDQASPELESLVVRDFSQWNQRWHAIDNTMTWNTRCRKLWMSLIHIRLRFIIWGLLNHQFYCNQRGRLWGIDPECLVCEDALESIEHLFYNCHQVKHRWEKLRSDTKGTTMDFGGCLSLRDIMLLTIAHQRRCPTLFLLIAETITLIWTERNAVVFRDKWTMAPTTLIWC